MIVRSENGTLLAGGVCQMHRGKTSGLITRKQKDILSFLFDSNLF
jgi:hypothetical protein